jgi:hypothetical protein
MQHEPEDAAPTTHREPDDVEVHIRAGGPTIVTASSEPAESADDPAGSDG